MFLGNKIAQQRKLKNITQTELANGICTQNTISKIEKHNVPPTTKILIKLCQRIDLTLNDVFSDFNQPDNELTKLVKSIEYDLYNYNDANQAAITQKINKLHRAPAKEFLAVPSQFITAFFKFRKQQFEDAIFECDKVLASTKSDDTDVYTMLAYTIKGSSYKQLDKIDNAEYYFNIVDKFINTHHFDQQDVSLIPIIFMCNQLARYDVLTDEFKRALKIGKIGIRLNNQIHTTYFMDSLFKMAAEAGQKTGVKSELIKQYQQFAKLFADYQQFNLTK